MNASPDPVDDPDRYRELVLSYLGADYPVGVQTLTLTELRVTVDEAGESLRERPAKGEWSVLEVAGHIADSEMVRAARYRWILAHDEPSLIGFDQNLWVEALAHNGDDPALMLDAFEALRRANLDLWGRTPAAGRERVGMHEERGPESFDLSFRLAAGHDLLHLEQARRSLEAVRSR